MAQESTTTAKDGFEVLLELVGDDAETMVSLIALMDRIIARRSRRRKKKSSSVH